jgi:thioester reductase-like protein
MAVLSEWPAMKTLLVTGYPGFLASSLLPRILTQRPEDRVLCLIESRFMDTARQRLQSVDPALAPRVELVPGDITRAGLGLDTPNTPDEIFHFAAIYDLGVSRDVGLKINLEGTQNVLRYAERCSRLEKLHYVSTCYVSGRYAGPYRESDLDKGQRFNNYYEETKFLAEVEVQKSPLPWVIYRPAIVVGDSRSGATLKYDGPYPIIKWLLRFPFVSVLPGIGDPAIARLNLVTQDFVLDALTYLSLHASQAGTVYQLSDPQPLTVQEMVRELGRACRRKVINLPVPRRGAKIALKRLPGVAEWSGFTPEMVDYFVHPTHYLCDNTLRALEGTGIAMPDIRSVLPRLVEYVKRHPVPVG